MGVVEPRVVAKIPPTKVKSNNISNNTSNTVESLQSPDFLPSDTTASSSLNSPEDSNTSRKRPPALETAKEAAIPASNGQIELPENDVPCRKKAKILKDVETLEKPSGSDSLEKQESTANNSPKLISGLRTNQESFTVQQEKEQSKQKKEQPEPFVVYNYMDNLPTFSNLTPKQAEERQKLKSKQDSLVQKEIRKNQSKSLKSHDNSESKLSKANFLKSKQDLLLSQKDSLQSKLNNIQSKLDCLEHQNQENAEKSVKKCEISDKTAELEPPIIDKFGTEKTVIISDKEGPIHDKIVTKEGPIHDKTVTKLTIQKESDGKWMYCKVQSCHFWTRKQVRMERHEKSHVPGDDKFYQCPECKLKICSLSKLLRHDRKFHTGFKDYECKICEAEVTDIAVHMRVSFKQSQFVSMPN